MSEAQSGSTRKEFLAGVAMAGAIAAGGVGFVRKASAQDEAADAPITQTAAFGYDPERKDEAKAAIETLVSAVEANEPDVTAYVAHFAEGNKIFFYEIYKNEAALENHSQQPHLNAIREHFASGLFKLPLDVNKIEMIHGFSR